ncbi:baseplate multidomain protein megatron [Ensifer soli]|uniref:baseplate multidomain protein megatron n=1 Tax=Ciceribacter sp. sgz301302 TaxID=3342379 RepID=UPI0035B948F5
MATILLQAAGAALGGVFGPFGAAIGRAAGALAGSAIDRTLINGTATISGRRLADARISGAEEGAAIPRVYGTMRVGGTLIWATRFEEEVLTERSGGKAGGARVESFSYYGNFAFGICEGPIAGVRRVWVDGRELDLTTVEMRLYRGTATQGPDPLIEAKQGTGAAPAYRNLAYAVFERLPLDGYGNRVPLVQFEVMRVTGRLERQIRAVTMIPGSSEYGYDPAIVSDVPEPGTRRLINRNVLHGVSDWSASLDELQALCPNLERVALVVSWFGTDLRAGHCRIRPGVETATRTGASKAWSVSGIARGAAHRVSDSDGAPAYGGTPSDDSVVAAIADLKARGLKVYLYPFVMMDVAAGNSLPNPYGGTGQPAYPWRGRISCHPAPGETGTADRTAAARLQVEDFCGTIGPGDFVVSAASVRATGADEGFRRLVLHYAHLAAVAGGVDGFIIGSEMRGLTRVRDDDGRFPFVEALMALADDVRGIVGPGTALTYAADWSEYAGYQPAGEEGVLLFNLDPLWAHAAIDAVGIDNYLPLADWRDADRGTGNPDGFLHAEDGAAMGRQILAGEYYDWYYKTSADRTNRIRTPITDGLAGKPWVFRAKDIPGWWANPHYGRGPAGEDESPSPWIPGSKPVWFTEIGCPAIDKGANQPNVFTDPKSSESFVPHFSSGARADAMQRRFLEAALGFWQGDEAPAGCVDPDHVFVWTWDARPAPAFPDDTALWSDGANWRTGHWLNGRLGTGTAADVIAAILADHGFSRGEVTRVAGDLGGYVQAALASARDMLEPLMAALSIDAVDRAGRLALRSPLALAEPPLALAVLAETEGEALVEATRTHGGDDASAAVIDHLDAARDHEQATTRAVAPAPDNARVLRLSLPAVLHEDAAGGAVEDALRLHQLARTHIRCSLSPDRIALEAGDLVRLSDGPAGPFIVTRIEEGARRVVEARAFQPASGRAKRPAAPPARPRRGAARGYAPVVHLLDLPHLSGAVTDSARIAVFARPWRTTIVSASPLTEGYRRRVVLRRPARIGRLVEALGPGASGRFDHGQAIELDLYQGAVSSADRMAVLNGDNRLAIRAGNGAFEVVGFLGAEEVAAGRFRLTGLLRGLSGTEDAMRAGAAPGAEIVVLDNAVQALGIEPEEAGQPLNWIVQAHGGAGPPTGPFAFAGGLRALTPLSPVHLRAQRTAGGDIALGWIRRARIDADHWLDGDIALDEPVEAYRVEVLDGTAVKRSFEVPASSAVYTMAQELADFGDARTSLTFRVRQRGAKVALGLPAVATCLL